MTLGRLHLPAVALLVAALHPCPAHAQDTGASTVLGNSNPQLADGAAALQAGRIELGIRLTLEGLKLESDPLESAAGHSNVCAGYALLKQWDEALTECNAALELDTKNWRIYNNRAAIFVAKGLYELAQQDLEAGLALAPGSSVLHESLRVLEQNRRILLRHKKAVPA